MIKRIFLYILLLVSFSSRGQMIDSMMPIYSATYPQEKIYIHFDKSYYNAGETIWFKAYIMSGSALSEISRNMYFELADEAGKIIDRKTAPIALSSSAASFTIPAGYARSLLHFRAYTTWMLNFDTAFLYDKTIRIVSGLPAKTTAAASSSNSLRFFPEGGGLVTGVESVLAFKATDPAGKPVNVKGSIFNKAGKKVTDFTSIHYGMGTLSFTPASGESYIAKWKDANAKEQTTAIPTATEGGIVMHLVADQEATQFTLRRNATDSGRTKKLLLIAHMNQQLVFKAKVNFSAAAFIKGSIPTNELPSGILQVTLFDEEERPLQERIVFINNNNYIFDAYVNVAKKLVKRGKNTLQIEVPDTLLTNLSVAVTDAAVNVPDENEDNIYSRFLLSGELRGYIHNAGYYFSSFADSTRRHLDLVMLTNGWRRFNWDDLAKGKLPDLKYKPEDYQSIQGKITGVNPPTLAGKQLNMIVELKDSSKKILMATVSKEGTFRLPEMSFYDTARIHFLFNNDKTLADRVNIHFDNGLFKNPSSSIPFMAGSVASIQDSVINKNKQIVAKYIELENESKKVKVLQSVVVQARVKSPKEKLEEKYTSGLFSGGDGYSFDISNDPAAMGAFNIFNYLQGRVAGLQITPGNPNPTLSWQGGTPGVYLDEMPVDIQTLSNIPVSNIAYVKVLRPGSGIGIGGGGGGTIAVYTKRGEAAGVDPNFKGLNKTPLPGYSPIKEFYSPDYASLDTPRDREDVRITLYWNPFIVFDKKTRKMTVSFYNNDITKKLRVIIEGVNEEGKLTRIEELIQ